MSLFNRQASIEQAARRDALAGVKSIDDHIVLRLGPRPKNFDPVGDHNHGKVAAALGRRTEIAEWSDDLRRAQAEAGRHPSTVALNIGILFCFLVEILGGILIMRALGVGEGERLPLGVALGLALIGITAVTSQRAGATSQPGSPQRRNTTALILAVYSLLVIALAVVRLRLGSEEGGGLEALPETVVMIATTVGPAWLAEYLLRCRRPAALVAAEVGRLKRLIKGAERERGKGETDMGRLLEKQSAWDEKAARLRATFEAEHRITSAEQGPVNNTIDRR